MNELGSVMNLAGWAYIESVRAEWPHSQLSERADSRSWATRAFMVMTTTSRTERDWIIATIYLVRTAAFPAATRKD